MAEKSDITLAEKKASLTVAVWVDKKAVKKDQSTVV